MASREEGMTQKIKWRKLVQKLINIQGNEGTMTNWAMHKDTSTQNAQKSKNKIQQNIKNKTDSHWRKYILVGSWKNEEGKLNHFIREIKMIHV